MSMALVAAAAAARRSAFRIQRPSLSLGLHSGTHPVFPSWIRRVTRKKSGDPEPDAITGRARRLVKELAVIAEQDPPEAMIKGSQIIKELAEIAKSTSINASYIEKNNVMVSHINATVKAQGMMNVLLFGLFFAGLLTTENQLHIVQIERNEAKGEIKGLKKRTTTFSSEQETLKRKVNFLEAKVAKLSQAPEEAEAHIGTEEAEVEPEPVEDVPKAVKGWKSMIPFYRGGLSLF